MKKRLFFGFALFVGIAMMVAWKFAVAELADLQNDADISLKKKTVELAYTNNHESLFI